MFHSWRRFVLILLCFWICSCSPPSDPSNTSIRNGQVWRDTSGNEIWCNGGQILQKDSVYYWVGYDTGPGRNWKINLYSSTNLMNWQFRKTILQDGPGIPKHIWAGRPGLLYNSHNKNFILIFESETGAWFRHKVGYATSTDIDGPYHYEHSEYPEKDQSTGDQSLYQEGDDAYLLAVLDQPGGSGAINDRLGIFKLTPDYLHVERKVFEGFDRHARGGTGHEAPFIVKISGTYYWFVSGLEGWNSTRTYYSTAKRLSGPWSAMKEVKTDPRSWNSFNTQHDFIITVRGSKQTVYVYAGDRYSQWTRYGKGKNIFLPVIFRNGRPVLQWMDSWSIDIQTGRYHEVKQAKTE